jgi:uncharacterized protein YegP (UPF0339 family)
MMQGASKFLIYREVEDGYRWRLRSDTGETLAATETAYPTKSACEADLRTFMAGKDLEAERS